MELDSAGSMTSHFQLMASRLLFEIGEVFSTVIVRAVFRAAASCRRRGPAE